MQVFESRIVFHCPSCSQSSAIDVQVPELNFLGDKMSEHTSEGEVWFSCPHCSSEFEGYAFCTGHECSITVEEHGIELVGDPPMYSPPDEDDWDDYGVPDHPYAIFVSTHEQMLELLEMKISPPSDMQLVSRMVFSQGISALEAFLSDTLLLQVVGDKDKTSSLLSEDVEVNKQSFSLKDIVGDETIVDKHVEEYLRKIIYHNLGKVQFLYRAALGFDIKVSDDDWAHLHKAVQHRHDCVHRNGFDREGNKNKVFTGEYVTETLETVKRLVDHVDDKLSPF